MSRTKRVVAAACAGLALTAGGAVMATAAHAESPDIIYQWSPSDPNAPAECDAMGKAGVADGSWKRYNCGVFEGYYELGVWY